MCTYCMGQESPNFLWLVCEDQSLFFSMYGDSSANTPNINQLAKDGLVYQNCYTPSPVCAPSRSSIITGMYPSSLGTLDMRSSSKPWMKRAGWVPDEVLMYPEVLRTQGYYCTNNTKEDYNFDLKREIWD